jgi:hypothetical protein
MKFHRLLLIPVLGCVLYAQGQTAKVILRVVETDGRTATGWEIASFRDASGREWKGSFKEDGTANIPVGKYTLSIESLVDLPFNAELTVASPETLYVAGLVFAGMHNVPPSSNIHGRFKSPPAPGAWCQLIGLYAPLRYFASIQSDGQFTFRNAAAGTYSLNCSSGSQILFTQTITFSASGIPDILIPSK